MTTPVTITSAKALGSIMSVAGSQLHNYFSLLIPSLINELIIIEDKVNNLKNKIDQYNSNNNNNDNNSGSNSDKDYDKDVDSHDDTELYEHEMLR